LTEGAETVNGVAGNLGLLTGSMRELSDILGSVGEALSGLARSSRTPAEAFAHCWPSSPVYHGRIYRLPWRTRPMTLNIKSAEAHELTRELAKLTGESLTEAVTTAVRERLERMRGTAEQVQVRAQVLLGIGRDTAGRLTEATRTAEHGELLYDEHGLPR